MVLGFLTSPPRTKWLGSPSILLSSAHSSSIPDEVKWSELETDHLPPSSAEV
jgi:hypothetical protein